MASWFSTENEQSTGGFTAVTTVVDVETKTNTVTAVEANQVDAATATPQETTVSFTGSFDQGDIAKVTIGTVVYEYTVQAGDDADVVVNGLLAVIAADNDAVVTAEAQPDANGVLVLTQKDAAGGPISITSAVTDVETTENAPS